MVQKMIIETAESEGGTNGVPSGRTWLAIAGGALGAVAAASCCVVPLALFTLGISGAWIGNLTALAPYQPIFVALAAPALIYGFVRVYRSPARKCDNGTYCGSPSSTRVLKVSLWVTTFLVIAAVAFPYAAVQFIE
ncbi:Mercuric transport protein MerT precursor [Sphingopyxis sp. LC81]|uniref:mercuric transporter MerT family protein n=1 Tax=unclassified Sphingopyxis TaxID=2614943 RepID=UPI00050FA5C3|nr:MULTISPECIES: mercuric transporter MerT family protein [unclassified Sphingopyxis]KGB53548.1 Mercuric transport protein MerT precursor [Sphingopyxis sp. LC81]MDT7531286.1 mercuric transporter MerT family protein [Sphingopyxis sp. SE2]